MDHSQHFSRKELQCGQGVYCDCGQCDMDPRLLSLAETIRHLMCDIPMVVTSAYRCTKHNAEVGGVTDPKNPSKHTLGQAMDFYIPQLPIEVVYDRILVAHTAGLLSGLGGIGLYPKKGFIHIDVYHAPDGHLRKWRGK